jgi:predicted acyltransferase
VLLPGKLYQGTFDPEGLFSTLPAIVTALLGMFTGKWVRESRIAGTKKSLCMALMAVAWIIVGAVWSIWFPINKKLWTSTFVLVVGGYSLLLFALFYYIIDVKGYRRWTLFFRVVGMNSITIYMAQLIINFHNPTNFFFKGIAGKLPDLWGELVMSTGYIAICWLFLYFLYRKRVFLKV